MGPNNNKIVFQTTKIDICIETTKLKCVFMKLRSDFSPKIKHILFDIGNVLIDLDTPSTIRSFSELRKSAAVSDNVETYQSGPFLDYELGLISDSEFAQAIRDAYDCPDVGDARIFAAWNAMLPKINRERFNLIRSLKGEYHLFVLSNTNHGHIEHVKKIFREASGGEEFESFFEHCFYSHDMHLRKPDPEIYRQVIRQTGVNPQEMLFIDDNRHNILQADALLLKTYHLTGEETLSDLFG